MSVYDRLSNVRPRSLVRLDRAVYRVFGEHLFSEEELRSLLDATSANRKARIKTKLQLKYSDPSQLYRVQFLLLYHKIKTAMIVLTGVVVLGITIAYLVFMQLPRAYTIGHDIRLDPTEGKAISLTTLNLYVPKTNAGTEEAVESMLYKGQAGAKVLLARDEFFPWLFRRTETFMTDSACITTDAKIRDAYRAFFSEFIDLEDITQSSSVRNLNITDRKAIFSYLQTKNEYAGAVLATLSGHSNNFKLPCSGDSVPTTCLWPFNVERNQNGSKVLYFIALRKNGKRYNLVISQTGSSLRELIFKYRMPGSLNVLDEQRELFWMAPIESCICMKHVPQYFVDQSLYSVFYPDSSIAEAQIKL